MQKKDLFNHIRNFESWENSLTPEYIEEGMTKANSKLFVEYMLFLGKRHSKGYAYRNLTKIRSIFKGLQISGVNDISKIKEKQVNDYFEEWCKTHSIDYVRRFVAFWNWNRKENRKKGIVIQEIEINALDFNQNSKESIFVWFSKEEFDKIRTYFDEDKQTILLFIFDSIIRAPTELASLKVENIYQKNGEVWADIPKEISKTIGRKFNLVYSGEAVLNYIKKYDKKPEEYLFDFSSSMLNKEIQKIALQIFGNRKSEGGEYFKNATLYDLRHSGAIHFRQLFQKTGQSLDLLRERGGWSDFKMINYYTKRLGLDGHIQKEKLLLEEDKTKLEIDLKALQEKYESLKKKDDEFKKMFKSIEPLIPKMREIIERRFPENK